MHLRHLAYSLRRYYVDEFFLRSAARLAPGSLVLDMGGISTGKRGLFDVGCFGFTVHYANISRGANPHFLCDLAALPVKDGVYDGVILAEVMEHIYEPARVLREAHRVLRPGGRLFMSAPFLFHVHPDPCDFGRYTDKYYRQAMSNVGFTAIRIEKQGLLFSVLVNMLKCWAFDLSTRGLPRSPLLRVAFHGLLRRLAVKAVSLDLDPRFTDNPVFSGHTTGYGIVCEK